MAERKHGDLADFRKGGLVLQRPLRGVRTAERRPHADLCSGAAATVPVHMSKNRSLPALTPTQRYLSSNPQASEALNLIALERLARRWLDDAQHRRVVEGVAGEQGPGEADPPESPRVRPTRDSQVSRH